jgi:hypothetical protein
MVDEYVEIGCSMFIKGVLLLRYWNVTKVMEMSYNIHVMINLILPLRKVHSKGNSIT